MNFARLPSLAGYAAGIILGAAAVITNARYGLIKGGADPALQAVWSGVAISASLAVSIAIPALSSCIRRRDIGLAICSLAALVLAGSYTLSGALGAAAQGRMDAATAGNDSKGKRDRAEKAYSDAVRNLDAAESTRAVAEIENDIKAKIGSLTKLRNCDDWVPSVRDRQACVDANKLKAELARAQRRGELETAVREAKDALDRMQVSANANSDAKALTWLARQLGFDVPEDAANLALMIIAVALLELGPGLLFAMAGALSSPIAQAPSGSVADGSEHDSQERSDVFATGNPQTPPESHRVHGVQSSVQPLGAGLAFNSVAAIEHASPETREHAQRIIQTVEARGGRMIGSQRSMATVFGLSLGSTNAILHELANVNLIKLTTTKRGTAVELLPSPRLAA